MAFSRSFGQAQNASPWTSGVPPGPHQQQQLLHQQQHNQLAHVPSAMFQQPMGAFDISVAWQAGQPNPTQQWVAPVQPVQFLPNPVAFVQNQVPHMQQQHLHQQMQQGPIYKRSLSASRVGSNVPNKRFAMSQSGDFTVGNHHWRNNNVGWRPNQQRATRQQSRPTKQNNPKVQSNNNNYRAEQNSQAKPQQATNKQNTRNNNPMQAGPKNCSSDGGSGSVVKVSKAKKQNNLRAKQSVKPPAPADRNSARAAKKAAVATEPDNSVDQAGHHQPAKTLSKTAERRQLKLQARRNAEGLKQSQLPVSEASETTSSADAAITVNECGQQKPVVDQQIDQAQLKCVPAVFGFVCKLCDVFLRDKIARREHIDSDNHMERFKIFEKESVANDDADDNNVGTANDQTSADLALEDKIKVESTDDNDTSLNDESTRLVVATTDDNEDESVDGSAEEQAW